MRLILLICTLALCACSPAPQESAPPSQFVMIGEKEALTAYTRILIVQHRETGRRYIIAYHTEGGLSMLPLDSTP